MAIRYRKDPHLEFLKTLDNDELEVLCDILIKDLEDNELRLTQELTSEENYKLYYPNHKKYWDLIGGEYQLFGGNTFANIFRGYGVPYKEILEDVLDKMDIKYDSNSLEKMEQLLLEKILEKSLEDMSDDEKKALIKSLNLKTSNLSSQAIMAALQLAIRQGGFVSYQIAVIVANSVSKMILGRGLSLFMNATLTKYISIFAGPIGWVITGLWTAIDLAGPAYRVTIPATIYIASLRQSKLKENLFTTFTCPNCNNSFSNDGSATKCPYCGTNIL